MDFTKLITGTVVGTIVGLIVGWLIFGLALGSYMSSNASMLAEPNMPLLAVGHVFFALLITYIFLQWAGISTAASGAKAGALIALLCTLALDFIYAGTTDLFTGGVVAVIVDGIGSAIVWAIGGAAIGAVLGRGAK